MAPIEKSRPPHHRSSLFGPLLLVLIGIVLLVNNLGGLRGDIWDILWRLWPLLFIAGALDSLWRREGLVVPVLGLSLGVVFLLSNFNLLAWDVWSALFQLWPVFLVAIGLDLVLGRRSFWGGAVALILLAAVLAGALWYFGTNFTAGRLMTESIGQALEDASQAKITIQPSVGSVSIKALDDLKLLIAGEVMHTYREKIVSSYELNNSTAEYSLKSVGVEVFYPTGPKAAPAWNLGLSDRLPVDLSLKLGVGDLKLDLSQLKVNGLSVNLGVGQATITLPETLEGEIRIEGAVGEITLIIPKGLAVRVLSNTGIGNLEAPPGYEKQDGAYVKPASSAKPVDIHVAQAIGRVVIVER